MVCAFNMCVRCGWWWRNNLNIRSVRFLSKIITKFLYFSRFNIFRLSLISQVKSQVVLVFPQSTSSSYPPLLRRSRVNASSYLSYASSVCIRNLFKSIRDASSLVYCCFRLVSSLSNWNVSRIFFFLQFQFNHADSLNLISFAIAIQHTTTNWEFRRNAKTDRRISETKVPTKKCDWFFIIWLFFLRVASLSFSLEVNGNLLMMSYELWETSLWQTNQYYMPWIIMFKKIVKKTKRISGISIPIRLT